VAFEEDYRIYQDVIAASVRLLRPRVKVESAELGALGDYIERFDPQLVISTHPNSVDPGGRPPWVELSLETFQPAKVCVGGRYSERTNPTLDMLLGVIDELEELLLTNEELGGC
jgi:hypothetical protein